MSPARPLSRARRESGQGLIEFAVVTFISTIMLLFVSETGRMIVVYTTIANAAREGVRYAIVHGSTRSSGTTSSSASGPSSDPAQVLTVVNNFASGGLLTTSRLIVHVTYLSSSNAPGHAVRVTVVYPYDPLTTSCSAHCVSAVRRRESLSTDGQRI